MDRTRGAQSGNFGGQGCRLAGFRLVTQHALGAGHVCVARIGVRLASICVAETLGGRLAIRREPMPEQDSRRAIPTRHGISPQGVPGARQLAACVGKISLSRFG